MARREALVWERCESIEDAERLLIENQKEHRFNALSFWLPIQWEVLGEEVLALEISSPEAVRNLVLRLKDRLPDTPLLNILICVSALVRDEGLQIEWPALKSSLRDVAREVGLLPALEKGIDEFDGAFLYPSGKFLNLAKTIEQYGNTLKGFQLQMALLLKPQKPPASEFQQLCSALPSMEWLEFGGVDLGHDSRVTDAICELVSRCATTLRGLSLGKLSRHSMEALGKVLASPTCRLEELNFNFQQYECLNCLNCLLQGANSLRDLSLDFEGEEVSEDVPSVTAFSVLTSLESLQIWGTVDKILKGVCEALEAGQLLQLHTLSLYRLQSEEGVASLAAALQSPGCSLRKLRIYRIGTEMDSLMHALPSSKIEALDLSEADKDPNKAYIALGQALHDPTCKLTVLRVGNWKQESAVELPKSFFEGLQKNLTLRSLCLADHMTLDDQAMLGGCLKYSNLQELECTGFQHDHLFEGLLASKVITLRITGSLYNLAKIYDMAKICDMILENPACKLRSLELVNYCLSNQQAILEQKQVLEALDRNYQSCLEDLDMDWSSEAMKKKCSDLLKRNSLFRAVAINIPDKDPYVANLFICGQSGAGKTTIKKNISRKIGGRLPLPACFQRHSSTSGIEMHPLAFNKTDERLLVYDMAGQFEFHAFHHSFIRGIDKSLFLVVVKVDATPGNFNRGDVTRELVYWLRFIASHKSSSNQRKPKVFIALNFFLHGRVSSAAVRTDVLSLTRQNVQDYQEILDIDDDIMEVKATDSRSLKPLKVKLGGSLTTLLAQQLKVPGLCEAAKDMCMELKKKQNTKNFKPQKKKTNIVEVNDLGRKLMAQHCSSSSSMGVNFAEEDQNNIIRFVFLFLHDMGEVVYFEREDSSSKYAILDVEWFIHDVISLFIDPHKIEASSSSQQPLHAIADILSDCCGGDESKVEFIFQCLYQMGVLIPLGNWSGEWIPLPERVLVPALSGVSRTYPPFERKQEERYWGRRLECKDVKFKLFPSGIFAMIQSKVHLQCRNESFRIGSGWITFRADGVGVYLRIGGDTDAWTDRQWVEVMVLVPRQDGNTKAAENLMNMMKNCVVEVCFGKLEIGEEKVLRTSYVEFRMHENHGAEFQGTQQLNSRELAVPLSEIIKEIQDEGLMYHTWSHSREDKLSDLLLPSEEKRIVQKKTMQLINVCEDYERTVKVVYNTPHLNSSIPEIPGNFEQKDVETLAAYMRELARGNREQLDRMEATLDKIKERMEKTGEQVLAFSSKMLHSINVTCPRYPYLVDANSSKLRKYIPLQKQAKILYHCECAEGSHPVPNAEGIVLNLPNEWLKRWGPVLIPALVILFMGVKVGAAVAGVDPLVNALIDPPKEKIMEFISSNMDMESLDVETWKTKKPTKEEIEDVFEALRRQSKVDSDREEKRMMLKSFGLQWDTVAGAWLCGKHYLE